MPIASRTSKSCLEVFSRQPNHALAKRFHPRASFITHGQVNGSSGSYSARAYATAVQSKSKEAAPTPSKGKRPAKGPTTTSGPVASRVSSSGLKNSLRRQQQVQSKKDKDVQEERWDEDPDGAQAYMNNVSKQAAGLDIWSSAELEVLGAFVIRFCISTED